MKKTYETPSVEKVAFQYRDQVVVASNWQPETGLHWKVNTDNCDTTVKPTNPN